MGDEAKIANLEANLLLEDMRTGCQPDESVILDDLKRDLAARLTDPNLQAVFRLVIHGLTVNEVAAKLKWDTRNTERMIAQIRNELRPWYQANFPGSSAESVGKNV